MPLVSIGIPAYKQPFFLKKCLESIVEQTYKNIEIIITDDSPDNSVTDVYKIFANQANIKYFKNEPSLGSPANWNSCIRKLKGDLIMLMHHDDRLACKDSLKLFVKHMGENPDCSGVFCRSTPVDEKGKKLKIDFDFRIIKKLNELPDHLIRSNQIGPPSNLMIWAKAKIFFREDLIWLVDVEFYIRLVKRGYKFSFINERLVQIGVHKEQITNFCLQNPEIVLRENIILSMQTQPEIWNSLKFYDYYWRLFRNHQIRSINDLERLNLELPRIPDKLIYMLNDQKKVSLKFLKYGLVSKLSMFLSYLSFRIRTI